MADATSSDSRAPCTYYNSWTGCKNGTSCPFSHAGPGGPSADERKKEKAKIQSLKDVFHGVQEDILKQVLRSANGDVQRAVDHLLTMDLGTKNTPKPDSKASPLGQPSTRAPRPRPTKPVDSTTHQVYGSVVSPSKMPTIAIFHAKNQEGRIKSAYDILLQAGAPKTTVHVIDVATDLEMQNYLNHKLPTPSRDVASVMPIVVIGNRVIEYNGLARPLRAGELEKLIKEALSDDAVTTMSLRSSDDEDLRLGIIDHMIDTTEYILKAPVAIPSALVKGVAGLFTGGKEEPAGDYQEFNVIQSNWYWRHQRRRLRCTKTHILRLLPEEESVRAAHEYTAIEKIEFFDVNNMSIFFIDGTADYIRCTAADVRRIGEIIISRRSDSPPQIVNNSGDPALNFS